MIRRQLLFVMSGAAALLGAARTGHAKSGAETSAEFVAALDDKRARLLAANTPLSEGDFYPLFARELRRLMRAPRHFPRDEPIGRILNAFFGWGVLPGTEVKIGKVAVVSGKGDGAATVSVEVTFRGERHQVLVHVVQENQAWRIADISYDSGNSLIEHYRRFTRG
jgi:hypothetical protein